MNTSTNRFIKDPDAVKDYGWDWTAWLADAEEITAATVTVTEAAEDAPAAPTKDSSSFTDTTATVWLSGGETSRTYHPITCHITTNQGRQDDRTIYVKIAQQ